LKIFFNFCFCIFIPELLKMFSDGAMSSAMLMEQEISVGENADRPEAFLSPRAVFVYVAPSASEDVPRRLRASG
jgi:hypothetical protein